MMSRMLLKVMATEHRTDLAELEPAPRSNCADGGFLTFPPWYKDILQWPPGDPHHCALYFNDLTNIWTIAGNILLILTQLAGLLAVAFIIYGGIRYIMSQGEPENLQTAKKILTNAILGLIIAILATTIVGFIAGIF